MSFDHSNPVAQLVEGLIPLVPESPASRGAWVLAALRPPQPGERWLVAAADSLFFQPGKSRRRSGSVAGCHLMRVAVDRQGQVVEEQWISPVDPALLLRLAPTGRLWALSSAELADLPAAVTAHMPCVSHLFRGLEGMELAPLLRPRRGRPDPRKAMLTAMARLVEAEGRCHRNKGEPPPWFFDAGLEMVESLMPAPTQPHPRPENKEEDDDIPF